MPTRVEVDRMVPGKECPIRGMSLEELGARVDDKDLILDLEKGKGSYLCTAGWRTCIFYSGYQTDSNTVLCDAGSPAKE